MFSSKFLFLFVILPVLQGIRMMSPSTTTVSSKSETETETDYEIVHNYKKTKIENLS